MPSVFCGNVELNKLLSGHYFKIYLPAGKYRIRSNDNQVYELNLHEGEETYLQMQLIIHGFGVKGLMVQVPNGEGEDELAGLHEAKPKTVTQTSAANLADLRAIPDIK